MRSVSELYYPFSVSQLHVELWHCPLHLGHGVILLPTGAASVLRVFFFWPIRQLQRLLEQLELGLLHHPHLLRHHHRRLLQLRELG